MARTATGATRARRPLRHRHARGGARRGPVEGDRPHGLPVDRCLPPQVWRAVGACCTIYAVGLPDPNTMVLMRLPGRKLKANCYLQGVRHLKIFGEYVPVRAEVVELPALSVHADANELVEWAAATPTYQGVVFAVHGEPEASASLCSELEARLRLPSRRTPTPRAHRRTPQVRYRPAQPAVEAQRGRSPPQLTDHPA